MKPKVKSKKRPLKSRRIAVIERASVVETEKLVAEGDAASSPTTTPSNA